MKSYYEIMEIYYVFKKDHLATVKDDYLSVGQNDHFISEMKLKLNVSEEYFGKSSSTLFKLHNMSQLLLPSPCCQFVGLFQTTFDPLEN